MAGCGESTAVHNSDYESEHSEVYAFVDDETIDTSQPEVGIPKRQRKKKLKKGKKPIREEAKRKKKIDAKPPSPRTISSKATFAQIAKEIKARRLAEMADALAITKKKKKNRVLREEEIYTDKDRAAAVNMGTSDIKQSLKMKDKQDRNYDSQTPEDGGDPVTLLALGNNELRNGNLKTALNFINQALQLNPEDKNGLVARSKCYLSLGNPQLALEDAEAALLSDKTFVRGIYQKAEALYHLGDFEHSLMYYHRGHRLRPELENFRLGIQKAQEAIENTIGCTAKLRGRKREKTTSSGSSSGKFGSGPEKSPAEKVNDEPKDSKGNLSSQGSMRKDRTRSERSKSAAPTLQTSSGRFFGELTADRLYLENLLKHSDLNCFNQEAANAIKTKAKEGIAFLKSRQEFWRQQKPNATSTMKIN